MSSNDKRDDQDALSSQAEQAEISGAAAQENGIEDAEIVEEALEAAETTEAAGEALEADPETDLAEDPEKTAEATDELPEPEPRKPLYEAAQPAPAPEKRGNSFVPGLLGGVTAAALGFGAAQFLDVDWLKLGGSENNLTSALQDQNSVIDKQAGVIADLESRLAEMTAAVAKPDTSSLESMVGKLSTGVVTQLGEVTETVSGLAGVVSQMQANMGEVTTQLAGMGESLSSVDERLVAVEKRPMVESSETAKAAFDAYEKEVARLTASLEALQAQSVEAEERMASLQADASVQLEQAEAEGDAELKEVQDALAGAKTEAAMVALSDAIQDGSPYGEALAVLSAAAPVPEALSANAEAGVQSYVALRQAYPAAARGALSASLDAVGTEAEPLDRVVAFFRSQTGARSLEPRDGSDPDAVLSRAEAAVKSGDLDLALTELQALPEAGQAAMSDWVGAASTRVAVVAAAAELSAAIPTN
ncbi:MAG: hypothetical protein OIF40_11685 [Mangrovicoccus sp.]|nr:hypothetical protein [Mangrovicoccus sp.]